MKKILIIILLFSLQSRLHAQFLDSLQVKAGTSASIASRDYLPLWLQANQFGTVADRKSDFTTHVSLYNSNRIGNKTTVYDTPGDDHALYLSYGLDAYNNDHLQKTFFEQAFVKAKYRKLTLSMGRFEQIIGEVDHDLSSGSLGVSSNARPIPQLNLSLDYTDIPFTNGWFQFKFMFTHGWMGNDQFLQHAFLHEDNLYVRFGKHKLKLYLGLQHYAVWGGERAGYYDLDRSLKGFFQVISGISANDGSTNGERLTNRPGDQRGVVEGGAEWENDNVKFQLNAQMPFDTGQGLTYKNIDHLVSLNIYNKQPDAIFKKLVLEFIYTKQMNDFYSQQYRESYYNNGVYRTGWEFDDHIIGTPLFINRVRAQDYFPDVKPYNWSGSTAAIQPLSNIVSNRVVGGHVGTVLALTDQLSSKTMLTYTQNYGNYNVTYFDTYKKQFYSLEELSYRLKDSPLSIKASFAWDAGDLSQNFGSMIGIQWQLRK